MLRYDITLCQNSNQVVGEGTGTDTHLPPPPVDTLPGDQDMDNLFEKPFCLF